MIEDGEYRGGEFVGRETLRAIMEAELGPKALLYVLSAALSAHTSIWNFLTLTLGRLRTGKWG